MSGVIPLPYTSWCGEGSLYLYLYFKFTLPLLYNDVLMQNGLSRENETRGIWRRVDWYGKLVPLLICYSYL